jgi:serine/threonine protein kinase
MLEALEDFHAAKFIHQDVKLDNFRVHDDYVKIIDFGIAMEYIKDGGHKAFGRYGF